jgi:hAT family C-terminal dimerisation region
MIQLAKYDDARPIDQSARESVGHQGPSWNAYAVLFGHGVTGSQTGHTSGLCSVEDEWSSYCYAANWPDIYSVDLVKWWDVSNYLCNAIYLLLMHLIQHNEKNYPRLFRWALDYLPAQASSVPAERIFSSSAETDTRRRNRISPELMEQLQMLKYMIKKARLDFTAAWKCEEKDIELENEWQDVGFSACEHNMRNDFNQLLDLLSDEEVSGAGGTSGVEEFHFSGDNSDDTDD